MLKRLSSGNNPCCSPSQQYMSQLYSYASLFFYKLQVMKWAKLGCETVRRDGDRLRFLTVWLGDLILPLVFYSCWIVDEIDSCPLSRSYRIFPASHFKFNNLIIFLTRKNVSGGHMCWFISEKLHSTN